MRPLSSRGFEQQLAQIREMISSSVAPLPEAGRKERREKAAASFPYFCATYLPHYFSLPPSMLHTYLFERVEAMIFRARDEGKGAKEADAAPRGGAKSTIITLAAPLWVTAFKYRLFPLLIGDTAEQAQDFLSFIRAELEYNERLAQDFPELCGRGPVWRNNTIITRNGVKIRGWGAGKKLRGMRHGPHRPDFIIVDDLENDEGVATAEQREKLSKWFFRALMKAGQPDTVFVVVGTILHAESLLSDLLARPGWLGRIFQAVIRWAENQSLWERWENIFRDATLAKAAAEAAADAFFEANREAMLKGTAVLWEEREPYYELMKLRLTDGEANFASEKQNEPVNREDCLFDIETVQFWEDDTVPGVPFLGSLDPSLGKQAKGRDPSAILSGWWDGERLWLEVADIEKRKPDRIIDDTFTYHQRYSFDEFGVETNQFQEYFAASLETEAKTRGKTLPVTEIRSSTDKFLRIQRLQPWIKNGWIRFRRHHRQLLEQVERYPLCAHDDGLDALEMLVTLCESALPFDYARLFDNAV